MIDIKDFVDFHSHILPGVDHGSDSMETTLFQLKSAKKKGIHKIVSTSHFYPTAHSIDVFLKKRNDAYGALLECCEEIPEILLGAEVLLCNGLDRLSGLDKLCISGTRYLLLELPFSDYSEEYTDTLKRLINDGFSVILAHADRYQRSIIEKLLNIGVKLQLNADALVGIKKIKNKYLFDWISCGSVVALGSDIHGKDARAYTRLRKAFRTAAKLSDVVLTESNKIFNESKRQSKKHKV